MNYTKILTSDNNVVSISNLQILDRDITNYVYETTKNGSLYCYTFEIGFDHSISAERLKLYSIKSSKPIQAILRRKPEYMLTGSTGVTKVFSVYIYVDKPQEIFTLRPKIIGDMLKLGMRKKTNKRNNSHSPTL